VYCNSTLRITPAAEAPGRPAAPVAVQAVEVPPAVIDEVKRMLLLGQHMPAVEYYSREARIPAAVAEIAVKGIEQSMAYYPPLTLRGVITLVTFEVISTGAILGAIWLLNDQQWLLGVGLLLFGLFTALGNTLVLVRGLRGFIIVQRGQPATARILKLWLIRTDKLKGMPVELTRLLLEVRPDGRRPYQAEANCFITAPSKPKFQVGSLIRVKYNPDDPSRMVVTGTE
jgi:hypothetical protein